MMRFFVLFAGIALAEATSISTNIETSQAPPRYVVYMDQWHTAAWPNETVTAGITHAITAFADPNLFITDPGGVYTPFMPLADVRGLFDDDTKICMAIGGWGLSVGFSTAARNLTMMRRFAGNVADTLDRLDYECVDIDWEYPGGNGADYKQIPNRDKTWEIDAFPRLLREIKAAIGPDKELSIAVPGLRQDMIAMHTRRQMARINPVVDFVNVMAYDLANRRSSFTRHHTSIASAQRIIETYLRAGLPAHKLVLGFALYAKWFTVQPNVTRPHMTRPQFPQKSGSSLQQKLFDFIKSTKSSNEDVHNPKTGACPLPLGCPLAILEDANGTDTKLSGVLTFETGNLAQPPANMSVSPSASCGFASGFRCGDGNCCSEFGFCGMSKDHCGAGCQKGYGRCEKGVVDISQSFAMARKNGHVDSATGAAWWFDEDAGIFWSWETVELIGSKIENVVKAMGLGGVMAWSLGEDSYDFGHVLALQKGVKELRESRGLALSNVY